MGIWLSGSRTSISSCIGPFVGLPNLQRTVTQSDRASDGADRRERVRMTRTLCEVRALASQRAEDGSRVDATGNRSCSAST